MIFLNIIVPTAKILGIKDQYIDRGSIINLTCIIDFSPDPPDYLFWYKDKEVISDDSSRGGIDIIKQLGQETTSYLTIKNAVADDSGKYTCQPSNAEPVFINLHILNGDRPAAAMHSVASMRSAIQTRYLSAVLVAWCLIRTFDHRVHEQR